MDYSISDTRVYNDENKLIDSLTVIDQHIQTPKIQPKFSFSLQQDHYIYPAFINSFDVVSHTLFTAINPEEIMNDKWLSDIKKYPIHINSNGFFSQAELLQLNHIKNIISGALSVCYPFETIEEEVYAQGFLDTFSYKQEQRPIVNHPFLRQIDNQLTWGTNSSIYGLYHLLEVFKKNITEAQAIIKPRNEIFNLLMGTLKNHSLAHFFIAKKLTDNPKENLTKIKLADIDLVCYYGKPVYGDMLFLEHAKKMGATNICPIQVENTNKFLAIRGAQKILKKLASHIEYLPQLPIHLN